MQSVCGKLTELGINYEIVQHQAVYTCEQAEFVKKLIEGQGCKNLFLKNQKKQFFVYTLPDDERADLKMLAKENGFGHLSFANEQELLELLGLKAGSVTPLGIINDSENKVTVLLDKRLEDKKLLVHPCTNRATVSLKFVDVLKFITALEHRYIIV